MIGTLLSDAFGDAVGVVPLGGSIAVFTSNGPQLSSDVYFEPPPGITIPAFDGPPAATQLPMPPATPTYYQLTLSGVPTTASRFYYTTPCSGQATQVAPLSGFVAADDSVCTVDSYDFALLAVTTDGNVVAYFPTNSFGLLPGHTIARNETL